MSDEDEPLGAVLKATSPDTQEWHYKMPAVKEGELIGVYPVVEWRGCEKTEGKPIDVKQTGMMGRNAFKSYKLVDDPLQRAEQFGDFSLLHYLKFSPKANCKLVGWRTDSHVFGKPAHQVLVQAMRNIEFEEVLTVSHSGGTFDRTGTKLYDVLLCIFV